MLNEIDLNVEWTQISPFLVADAYNHPPSICYEATQRDCKFTIKQMHRIIAQGGNINCRSEVIVIVNQHCEHWSLTSKYTKFNYECRLCMQDIPNFV
ncbi:unnamed protein product [Macrosiphum euphorbiae]|uniref:Uncharacterized protein n=1 Tax=Macrosiphum euphorbiae TaxID=13131 RepID=A0AAV0VVF5_9HEMI|nr:unnamed protein product [Macrosiphum euphorbiae]